MNKKSNMQTIIIKGDGKYWKVQSPTATKKEFNSMGIPYLKF